RFLGVVEQGVLRPRVVEIDLAEERTLGVVEVTPFSLDGTTGFAPFLLFPLGDDMKLCAHIEQAFEQERKRMRRGFLEREHLDEIFADAEVAAMALEMGLGEAVVEKRVVLQPGMLE